MGGACEPKTATFLLHCHFIHLLWVQFKWNGENFTEFSPQLFKLVNLVHLNSKNRHYRQQETVTLSGKQGKPPGGLSQTNPRDMSRNYQPPGFPTETFKASSRDSQPLRRRHVTLCDMALTPDNVPPFTIPPLCALAAPQGSASLPGRRLIRRRSALYELPLTDELHSICTPSDPAMSLLHVAKVTTPYGFVTLAERPQVRRKESLFFSDRVTHIPRRSDSTQDSCCSNHVYRFFNGLPSLPFGWGGSFSKVVICFFTRTIHF